MAIIFKRIWKLVFYFTLSIIIYIFFILNANVRINIKNNTNNILRDISIKIGDKQIYFHTIKGKKSRNITYNNINNIGHNKSILVKFELMSIMYEKKLNPYIEINDAYILYIQIDKNGKINYKGEKLLFSMNIFGTIKNYWYRIPWK